MTPKDVARFEAKYTIDDETGCWMWFAANDGYLGYGKFYWAGAKIGAHRFSHILHVGPIPDGYHVDHLCRTPPCVNPEHLEAVTPGENVRRGLVPLSNAERAKLIVECPIGHAYEGDNLYVTSSGKRQCKKCKALTLVRWRRRFKKNLEASA